MGKLRLFLALLILDWIAGFPGTGIDTRTMPSNSLMDAVYTVASLGVVASLILTWRGQRFVTPVAMATGALAAVLAVLDLFGVTGGGIAPAAMVIVDTVGAALGLGIVWAAARARQVTRFAM